jgi:hypothetical protein
MTEYEPQKIIFFIAEDDAPLFGTAIRYQGNLWLVPWWSEGPNEGSVIPARIISLSGFHAGEPTPRRPDRALILSETLNRRVLEGQSEGQTPIVIERPKIVLDFADIP